jgi:hypothetical protein
MEQYMRRAARYERAGDEQKADANYRKALRYQCMHFGSAKSTKVKILDEDEKDEKYKTDRIVDNYYKRNYNDPGYKPPRAPK